MARSLAILLVLGIFLSSCRSVERRPATATNEYAPSGYLPFVIISDLDDTLLEANVSSRINLIGNKFFKCCKSFSGVGRFFSEFYQEYKTPYFIITGSPNNASTLQFLEENDFPATKDVKVWGRPWAHVLGTIYKFKTAVLLGNTIPAVHNNFFGNYLEYLNNEGLVPQIASLHPETHFIFMGDNTEADVLAYRTAVSLSGINSRSSIFIREVDPEKIHRKKNLNMIDEDNPESLKVIKRGMGAKEIRQYYESAKTFLHVLEIPIWLSIEIPARSQTFEKMLPKLIDSFYQDLTKKPTAVFPAYQFCPTTIPSRSLQELDALSNLETIKAKTREIIGLYRKIWGLVCKEFAGKPDSFEKAMSLPKASPTIQEIKETLEKLRNLSL